MTDSAAADYLYRALGQFRVPGPLLPVRSARPRGSHVYAVASPYRINQRRIIHLGRSLYRSVGQRAPENVTDRKALAKAIAALGSGNVLVVTSWIGDSSTRDFLNMLDAVRKRELASARWPMYAWADTTTPHWRLMLTVLSGLAELERELIRSRTE